MVVVVERVRAGRAFRLLVGVDCVDGLVLVGVDRDIPANSAVSNLSPIPDG